MAREPRPTPPPQPLREGYEQKGGLNRPASQVTVRPPPPPASNPRPSGGGSPPTPRQ